MHFAVSNPYQTTRYKLLDKTIDLLAQQFVCKKGLNSCAESLGRSRLRGFLFREICEYGREPICVHCSICFG